MISGNYYKNTNNNINNNYFINFLKLVYKIVGFLVLVPSTKNMDSIIV